MPRRARVCGLGAEGSRDVAGSALCAVLVRAFVVHWDAASLPAKVQAVQKAGAEVVGHEAEDGQRAYREAKRLGPDVLIVWLQHKPSHGRLTAAAIRATAWGRTLPILFVDEDPDPVPAATLQQVKAALPDALIDRPARLRFWMQKIAALPSRIA